MLVNWRWLLVAGGSLALAACSLQVVPTVVVADPTATAPPTATHTPIPTQTFTPTPTATPTATPEPDARLHQAEQALAHGDWDTAELEFRQAMAQSAAPEVQVAGEYGVALTALRRGDYGVAIDGLTAFVEAHPADPLAADAWFQLAEAYSVLQDWENALLAYERFVQLDTGVIDSYIFERMANLHVFAGDLPAAASRYELALNSQRAGNRNFMRLDLADVYLRLGRDDDALRLYDTVFENTTFDATRAQMDLLRGRVYFNRGDLNTAASYWLHAVENYPSYYDSYSALVGLIDNGVAVDEFQRGLVNYHAGSTAPAINAFTRYINANPDDPYLSRYYLALTYREAGNIGEAVALLQGIVAELGPDYPLWAIAYQTLAETQAEWGGALANGRDSYLAFADAAPEHPDAPDALLAAGRLSERLGLVPDAVATWARLADQDSGAPARIAVEAAFLAGVHSYRIGEPLEALAFFERSSALAGQLGDLETAAASQLWQGKCYAALGSTQAARDAWQEAVALDPGSYASIRAGQLLNDQPPLTPLASYTLAYDEAGEREAGEAWLAGQLELLGAVGLGNLPQDLLSDGRWRRGERLWQLGDYNNAEVELDALRLDYASDPLASYQLALAFRELGYFPGTIYAARAVIDGLGYGDTPLAVPSWFTYLRYGPYYADVIVPAAEATGVDPLLMFALARQESLFDGQARSYAAAQGLLQIIPETGTWVASQLNWPDYSNADLYRPFINAQFGSYYLAYQQDYFDGNPTYALAAYNAGPGNAEVWAASANGDPELFVALVRFGETRSYVQRITEHYAIYQQLFGRYE